MLAKNQDRRKHRHFVPGEFFIVLQLPDQNDGIDKGKIIEATQSFLSQTAGTTELSNSLELLRNKIEEAASDPGELNELQYREALRVVQMTSDAQGAIQRDLNRALAKLQEDNVTLVGGRAHVFIRVQDGLLADNEDERILACFTGALDLRVREGFTIDTYIVIGASLNWLMANSQGNLTTGGPGALPVPPFLEPGAVITPDDYRFIDESLESDSSASTAPGARKQKASSAMAKVFILDTVPEYKQLTDAVDNWGENNDLIMQLLGPEFDHPEDWKYVNVSNRLTLQYYENQDRDPVFVKPLDYGILSKDYLMPDHGLFIAGIIRAQAECADLHMIQVLNDYGVGTFGALIWGLGQVKDAIQPGENTVLNCSLTLASDEGSFSINTRPIGDFLLVLHVVLTNWETRQIEDLYESLPKDTLVILAAAGNDSAPHITPIPAKNPAAFNDVHGVGALDSSGNHARYSNYADTPPTDGFLTFGGDANFAEAKVDTGILGIYTFATYPGVNATTNETGWARWAGTSFASAVVAGAYAERFCAGRSVEEAHCDLRKERYEGGAKQPFHLKRRQGRRNGAPPPR